MEHGDEMRDGSIQKDRKSQKDFMKQIGSLMGSHDHHEFKNLPHEDIEKLVSDFYIFDEEGEKFTLSCELKKFRKFGPGVYLLFSFLKHMIMLMAISCVVGLALLILLLESPYYMNSYNIVRLNLMRLTIASLRPQYFNFYLSLDLLIILIFLIGLIVWDVKMSSLVDECMETSKLPSYLTVVVKKIPKEYNEAQLKRDIERCFGVRIQEIYTARNFSNFLTNYKQFTDEIIELGILKQIYDQNQEGQGQEQFMRNHPDARERYSKKIGKHFLKVKDHYLQIHKEKYNQQKYEPVEIYLILKSYWERDLLIQQFRKSEQQQGEKEQDADEALRERKAKLKQQITVEGCSVEPEAIVWENIGLSFKEYVVRAFVVFFILAVFTCLGCILIFLLEILETAAIGDAYFFSEERAKKDLMNSDQCLHQSSAEQLSPLSSPCKKLLPDSSKLVILILATPLTIFICKKACMGILSKLVKFRRYPSQISRIESEIKILSLFYFIVSAVLHLCLYLKAQSSYGPLSIYQTLYPLIDKIFKLTKYSPASIHLYSDFSLDWYKEATFFIIIIGSTSFNIANLFKFLLSFITYHLQKSKALKCPNSYLVKKVLTGIDLHFQTIYASCIAITFFVFLYGVCIPLVYFFGLVNLLFLLFVAKWVFIKYGNRPLRIGHSVSQMVLWIMLIGILVHCVMAPMFLGASGIAVERQNYKLQKNGDGHLEGIPIVQRYLGFGVFYIVIFMLTVLYLIRGKAFIAYMRNKVKSCRSKRMEGKSNRNEKEGGDEYEQGEDKKEGEYYGLYPSYSMHNNQKYCEILKNIYLMNQKEARRGSIALDREISQIIAFEEHRMKQNGHHTAKQILQICSNQLPPQVLLQMQSIIRQIECQEFSSESLQRSGEHHETDVRINIAEEPGEDFNAMGLETMEI